MINIEFSAI